MNTATPTNLLGSLKDLPSEVVMELARILDLAASAGRLAMVAHGIAEKDSPACLLAWETFLHADDAAQSLSHLLAYGPVDLGA